MVIIGNIVVRLVERLILLLNVWTKGRVAIAAVTAAGSCRRIGRDFFSPHFIVVLLPFIMKLSIVDILPRLIIVGVRRI